MSEQATNFIKSLFGPVTESPVYVCSLANDRNDATEPSERHVSTRDLSDIAKFIAKWDRPKRGLFFCVSTVQSGKKRSKDNVVETIGLHVDIDFKDISDSRAEVERKLAQLRLPPSVTVFSGNGIHAYWLFNESIIGGQERIEQAMRQLADLVGGDLSVCEVARLMRLPGTHNTKHGQFTPVEELTLTDRRYELDDLEEWLAESSPVILRKERPAAVPADNPFLIAAARLGFKPSIDVEKRLQSMSYMGGGDASVHSTQLAVTASLLTNGVEREEVVQTVLDATRAAAGAYGERWNWRREERAIVQMCDTWLKKHPQQQPRSLSSAAVTHTIIAGSNVIKLDEHKQEPAKKPKPAKGGLPNHIVLGEAVIEAIKSRGDDLIFTRKAAWRYSDGLWTMEVDGLQAWLNVEIETACRALNIDSANRVISEARQWIARNPVLWRENVAWDSHGKIPTRSGLIDPITLDLTPPEPGNYCTWRVECDYVPSAKCPWWEVMISDFFGDRDETQRARLTEVIQECLGAAMIDIKPRALSKALILQGGSNFGKSGILEVLGGLFGTEQIATPLAALEGTHGLMAFTRRLPWLLHEAFDQSKWHFSSAVKAIITGEPVSINIKNGPMLSTRVKAPIFWGTNSPPQFKEATKAIINRMIVIECRREFIEGQPIGAAAEAAFRGFDKPSTLVLATELPGLLNWALAGLQRALKRGFIELTDEIKGTANAIRRDSNLVAGFLEECVEYDPDRRVSNPDFCAAFAVWWLEHKGEDRRLPSNEAIGKSLSAMSDPRIAINPEELRDKRRRYYAGIVLNEQGLEYWKRAVEASVFEGKTTNTTARDGIVNDAIPDTWAAKKSVIAMRSTARALTVIAQKLSPAVTDRNLSPDDQSPDDQSPTQVIEDAKKPRF
jgi:hypothetical protein